MEIYAHIFVTQSRGCFTVANQCNVVLTICEFDLIRINYIDRVKLSRALIGNKYGNMLHNYMKRKTNRSSAN